MTSSKFLKQLMRTGGLSQIMLANELATTQATISRLINNKYTMSLDLRVTIAKKYHYSYEYMINEID